MRRRPLKDIVAERKLQEFYQPLYQRHLNSIELIRGRAHQEDGVLFFDLTGYEMEGYNKFIPYYLFPDSVYTVSVRPSSFRTKISVGSNPWAQGELKHNLATICERYGGGGHARVGAISFEPGELAKARKVAAEIVEELKRENRSMSASTLVSVEEYLNTSYDPDYDYVDGRVVERNLGELDHSSLQTEISFYFRSRRKQWGVHAFVEQRVQVSPTRFRIPDICVIVGDFPTEQIFRTPPF